MKIALVSTPFVSVPPKDYGGTELIVHELAEGLVARGHEVTVFATGDSNTSGHLEALYTEAQWPPDHLVEVNHVSWAFSMIANREYDVVHCHAVSALAVARILPDLPLVYTLHHVRDDRLSQLYRYFPQVWYVAISDRQRELEIELPRIQVIHHGLDHSRYLGPSIPGEGVCFVGRLSEVKGPHIAIDVAEAAGAEIWVAGSIHQDDDDPTFAAREIRPRLERPHVHYLGPIGMDAKRELFSRSRAALVPLNWEEPFGLVMIEAMLCGCPVIAFPRGSAPELIEDGVTGFLVPDAQAMAELIRSGLEGFDRERCRARAVERFDRATMVAAYEEVYHQAHEQTATGVAAEPVTPA